MSIEESNLWKLSAFSWLIRLNTLKISLSCVVIMNVLRSTEYMDFMMNVRFTACALMIPFISHCNILCVSGKRRYNIKLWKTFTDCFNCLPVAAIVDEKILCMHGGLSPELQTMEQVKRIMRPTGWLVFKSRFNILYFV